MQAAKCRQLRMQLDQCTAEKSAILIDLKKMQACHVLTALYCIYQLLVYCDVRIVGLGDVDSSRRKGKRCRTFQL
jgi:hypothetical protein